MSFMSHRILRAFIKTAFAFSFLTAVISSAQTTETIVILRHGEKPQGGLGQLTCKGLNRALALPDVLAAKFGTPNYIFAPDPAQKVNDYSFSGYSYVRPLATIEPTAIRLGMSVNAQIGYTQIDKLQKEVLEPKYASSTLFIVWEHYYEQKFAKELVRIFGGDSRLVPDWSNDDYDMIYVIRLLHSNDKATVSFTVDHEGLNDKLSDQCPK
jgi:hypothetical protein